MNLILLRHGESQWNLENRFTGWEDIDLTEKGIEEAVFSGHQINLANIQISSIHTSLLKRAMKTAIIVSDIIDFPQEKIKYEWRLNERHYGSLQGLNKSETALKYGEDQVQVWRRSFDIPPPLLEADDCRHPKFNDKFKNISEGLPSGESLKDVILRLKPFWDEYLRGIITTKNNHLIVAHSNSLRAIVKVLEQLSSEEIVSVNIPTGVPLVYNLDKDLKVLDKKYLIDEKELESRQDLIVQQGKIK